MTVYGTAEDAQSDSIFGSSFSSPARFQTAPTGPGGVQNRAKNRKLNSPVPAREGCCFLKCQLISTSRRVVSFRSRGFRGCTSCLF